MKTIGVMHGATANKFWGVCGLIMHSAICNASHQTVQYKGGIYSQLSGVSRWVSVRHEDRSLSLVAKLSEASFSKFLSHSLNANIKKSHLKGFFTLNPSHAQSVVGMTGLLKGRLASLGLSISKYHFFSLNLHFSLLTKTRGVKPDLMLKRISAEKQSSLTESAVNFEEDLGIKDSSAIEVMKIDHHDSQADLSDRLDTKESLETENVQTKIENEQKSSLLEIVGMQGKEALENEIMNLKKSDKDIELLFEDIIEKDLDQIDNKYAEAKREQNIMAQTIDLFCKFANTTTLNMSNLACFLHRKTAIDSTLNERIVKCSDRNKLLGEYYSSIKKECRDMDEQYKEFQLRQHEAIKSVKNKFVEVNDLLHERLHKLFPDAFNQLFEFLKDENVECSSEHLWMQSDSEDKLKDALKDLDGAIQHEENLSELEHELCQLWKACLDIENNHDSLKERINSYIALVASMETLRDKINLGVSQKIIFEQEDLEILMKIDKILKRVEIFLDTASTIIFMGVKRVNKLKAQYFKDIFSAQYAKLREIKKTVQVSIEILGRNASLFSGTEE